MHPASFMKSFSARAKKRFTWRVLVAAWLAFLPLLTLSLSVTSASAAPLQLDPNMDKTWQRTDLYVAQGSQSRSWLWGPTAFSIKTEEYDGAPATANIPANQRLVAYYDKSRMEINNPYGDRNSKYFVTNGLLVKELISGWRAVGDNRFVPYLPAEIPVVGDRTRLYNLNAPTYASIASITSLTTDQNRADNRVGQQVTAYLDYYSTPKADLRFASYNVTIANYDNTFGHNIPKVFWDYMNSTGNVLENGRTVVAPVVDWVFSTGYPITDPYWTTAKVGGVTRDVLFQCFERRCFSYTPSNSAGFQVEMGNVGSHYFDWRYNTPQPDCLTLPVRGFGKLWSENPSVKARIGCPYAWSGEQGIKIASQHFEHGSMIWVNSNGGTDYYLPYEKNIIVLFDDGKWAVVKDTWTEGQPLNSGLTPPAGRYEPVRGFGNAWRNETALKLRERLGWAVEKETGGDGAIQNFGGGYMIWLGNSKEILVGYRYYDRTNHWEVYPDTFQG